MDPPPPLPPHPTTVAPLIPASSSNSNNHPDSANSSPRSRPDTWDEPLPPVPGAKLRLMCSYGGHIIPRPHDKSLCYVGGDTRIVVVDRRSSLSDFLSRLSHSLLNGRPFTLKYQLPNEELDSLVSVSTDEDLENMIEEYDRTTAASPLKPSRLRLFLFPSMPETANSMGSLLDDAKSETWFVDALNGTGLLPRGLSESAGIDNLLELDGIQKSDSSANLDTQNLGVNKQVNSKSNLPDSPMVEKSSSFESSSSSPSMCNLPPIKVRIENGNGRFHDQMAGLDEQFSQVSIAPNAPPPTQSVMVATTTTGAAATVQSAVNTAAAAAGEQHGRVISDDERSDHGAPPAPRKPPLPLQPVQRKLVDVYNLPSPDSKHAAGYSFPSPDSVASDSSIASAPSMSKHQTIYQDASQVAGLENRVLAPISDQTNTNQYSVQQFSDSISMQTLHQNQQQFIHPATHYIPHPAANPLPLSSYYPMYLPQTQQNLQTDPQYSMYLLPVNQSQAYNYIADSTIVASSQPLTPPINPSATADSETVPSAYPSTATSVISKPEMGSSIYRTTTPGGPMFVQFPSHQFHQQYIGLSQVPTASQPNVAAPPSTVNYGSEYSHPTNDQVYYAQHQAPSQYHTMTPATAVMLSQVSTQPPNENNANQIRT